MRVTRLGRTRPILSLTGILSTSDVGLDGQVPISNGSNSVSWGSNISDIFVNATTHVRGPFVNFADGSNTSITVDTVNGVASNTIRWHSTGGAGASFGSNSTDVSETTQGGASSNTARADHYHRGIETITASSSNAMQRGTWNLRPGSGIALSLTDSDGDGEFDTTTIVNTGVTALSASGAVVLRTATQSIAASTDVAVDFTAADTTDTDGYHDPASSSTRVTIPTGLGGAFFTIIGSFTFAASLGGTERIAKLRKNGTTTIVEQTEQGLVNADLAMQVSASVMLAAGEYVELIAWQDGVGAINIQANATLHIARNGGPGGGSSTADAVRNQIGNGEIVIPGLAGSPDIKVAAASDDEFDTTDTSDPMTGWTTLGTPTAHNINSTAKSHYYIKQNAGGVGLVGIYKANSPTFTVTAKLTADTVLPNSQARAGLFIAEAAPGKIETVGRYTVSGGVPVGVALDAWTNRTTFSSTPATSLYQTGAHLYLRIVVTSSTNVSYYYSYNGLLWLVLTTARNPGFTVGAAGLFIDPNSTGATVEALFDWIRFT